MFAPLVRAELVALLAALDATPLPRTDPWRLALEAQLIELRIAVEQIDRERASGTN